MTTAPAVAQPVPAGRVRWLARANYALDIALFVAWAVDYNLRFTGLSVHEWLGIVLGAVIVTHTVMHWDWIARTVRRLASLRGRQLFVAILTLLVFADVILAVVSGVLISRVAVPGLAQRDGFWRWLHVETANLATWLIALHIAVSWRWLWAMTKRFVNRGRTVGGGAEAET